MLKNKGFFASVLALFTVFALTAFLASTVKADSNIRICHHTGSGSYNEITVDDNATTLNGHNGHDLDIVPPIVSLDFAGLNWDTAGQAIYNNGCVVPSTDLCTNLDGTQTTIPTGYEDPNEDGICTTIEEIVDVCPNIEGNQAEIPDGYTKNSDGQCVLIEEPTDVCPNIEGNQSEIPEGYTKNEEGQCVLTKEPVDVCPNIEGNQENITEGMIKDEAGNCVEPRGGVTDVCPNLTGEQLTLPEHYSFDAQGNCAAPSQNNDRDKKVVAKQILGATTGGPVEPSNLPVGGGNLLSVVSSVGFALIFIFLSAIVADMSKIFPELLHAKK